MQDRPWLVMKFGGTSVSNRARWETIGETIRRRLDEGYRPFVVCSAVSKISRRLNALMDAAPSGTYQEHIDAIQERHRELGRELEVDADVLLASYFEEMERLALGASLTREVGPPLRARVLAMGELMSTTLGAAFLNRMGLDVGWEDARTMLTSHEHPRMQSARRYLSATCVHDPDPGLRARLEQAGRAATLTQGFIASTPSNETVLIGWGGSDTSAAYFSAKLQAERLEIWTDVPGMFTANPRHVPAARVLRSLGYDEAQELASTGAEVLHPRSIDPVRQHGIPLHIRCTQAPELEDHTAIGDDVPSHGARVKALSAREGLTLISMETPRMWHEVGFLARIFNVFDQHDISVDLVSTSETSVTVSVDALEGPYEPATIDSLLRDLGAFCDAREIGPCTAVSLVGRNLRSILHELAPVFEALDEHTIHMMTQAASDLNLTFVVGGEHADRLVRELHAHLFGNAAPDELLGPSWAELFEQAQRRPRQAAPWWHARRQALLDAAAEGPAYVYDTRTLQETVDALLEVEPVSQLFYAIKANPHPDILRLFARAGLGFECVSPGEIARVREAVPDIEAERILFTPNFASRDEYAAALEAGVQVTLDAVYPLEAWPELWKGHELLLRIDPGRGHGHHRHVRTAGAQSKFGIVPDALEHVRELADAAGATVVGLHAHLGSGIRLAEAWSETALFLASLAERLPDVRVLNLGGGLAVPDRMGGSGVDLDALEASLAPVREAYPQYALWLEPGRALVAEAGVLLARVTQTKQKGDVHYVGIETGMNSLLRPALYGAYHEIVNLSRLGAPMNTTAEVVGPICETGDVLGHSRRLPQTLPGDVLLVDTAGAYGHVMASSYNLRAPAREVVLEG